MTSCPKRFVGHAIADTLRFVDDMDKGMPPVAGGSLDQSAGFMAFSRIAWKWRDLWKAYLSPYGDE